MTQLEQQALESPAQRTLRSVGRAWWGVDPSTLRVSIAWRCGDELGAATRSFPRLAPGGQRLALIFTETRDLVYDLLAARHPTCGQAPFPGYVLVEQPSGDRPNPALQYAVGAVQAAIWMGISELHPDHVPPVETIPSPVWKKLALGRGDAGSKRRGGKIEILRWAQENGYTGLIEDEADAWGICAAARRLVAFE